MSYVRLFSSLNKIYRAILNEDNELALGLVAELISDLEIEVNRRD